jgi:surfeit locus 1 family protein
MFFKIQNWKLSLLAILFIGIFCSLGLWQVSRATEKKILLKSFAERTEHAPFNAAMISQSRDWRFYRAQLSGSFDNEHTVLLDNKTYEGKVGYEVYTPFKAIGLDYPILIDRGFIPIGNNRKDLPLIRAITGKKTITGMLNLPPAYVSFGKITDAQIKTWPLRVEYINLNELSAIFNEAIYPYVMNLAPTDPASYEVKWQIVIMGPEKHMGYALQWFAFALTLLILFVTLNRQKKNETG